MTIKEKTDRIKYLVEYLSKCSNEYYNLGTPSISDAQYDKLFDELSLLESQTGIILASSPTQRVGHTVLSVLPKVIHAIPLLSLAKTKDPEDIKKMLLDNDGYLALKIDGLTVELVYQNGQLTEASTRGNGTEGEVITHNARVFNNIPKTIPIKNLIRITGEAYIDIATFEEINEKIDNDEDKFSTPRNLAAGSVRQLDSSVCKERNIKFMPFNVLEGFEDIISRSERMDKLSSFGFDRIPSVNLSTETGTEEITEHIFALKKIAENKGLPIDGIVFFYDDAVFSAGLGRTSHHFRDGIAFKFSDPHFETVLNNVEWNISRTGQLTPVAIFSPVEIDNTIVERASLHNMTFVKELKLNKGDRIMVSKRNMIIPHVEENLTVHSEEYTLSFPQHCPICNAATEISTTENGGRIIEVLYCKNPTCAGKKVKKFTHFVSKNALNIDGLSEQTLEKFMSLGWLKNLSDVYTLTEHKDEIVTMEGFGEKSFNNLALSLEQSRHTTLTNLLVAMNIDHIGKSTAKLIEDRFSGDADSFITAVSNGFDFTEIEGFGEIMNDSIHNFFKMQENMNEFTQLMTILDIQKKEKPTESGSRFFDKKIVITGTFSKYTRDELSARLEELGAKTSSSVSSKTDYVLCGENAGSKLSKAKQLGVTVLYEDDIADEI
ncbi:MAG: NAD-dependent DNA ligase LigA [Acutalibacteraceae bacterium]|nr:NAD-dependent DNA ligase LigA [Acutalibacteraceae bacterium]